MTFHNLSEEQFTSVIDTIYSAAADSSQWQQVIKDVGTASGGFGGSLALWDLQQRQPPVSYNQAFPDDFWNEYCTHLMSSDPLAPAFAARPELEIYTGEMLISEEVNRTDEVRKRVRASTDQDYCYGARLFSRHGLESTLILARTTDQGAAGPDDIARLAVFLPHLRRSILLARKVGERLSSAALDVLSFGVLILDEAGQVSFANSAMSDIAAARDGIRFTSAGLSLCNPEEDRTYRRLVENTRRRSFLHTPAKTALTATRVSGRRPYSILVCPFPRADLYPSLGNSVLVCVSDPAQTSHITEETLAALYRLTPAEARLAVSLVRFGNLAAAAANCGLTEGSARQYMKRIFEKTGTHGQVELVALIVGSVRV